jgi:uncharacterized protein with HEPN domain
MRDYAGKVVSLTAGKNQSDLENDEILCLTITRLVELIGEAASSVALIASTRIHIYASTHLQIAASCGT